MIKKAEAFIHTLIIVSVLSFTLESSPNLNESIRKGLKILEIFILVVFTLEYGLRLYYSKPKSRYFFSFYGILDLCAILPFYLNLGVGFQSLRIVRLFRLFKLTRFSKVLKKYGLVLYQVKDDLFVFLTVSITTVYLSAVGIYYCEREAQPEHFGSIIDALWWAVVTLTTIGYGDAYPITPMGKLFTTVVAIVGIAIIAIPTGIIVSAFSRLNA